MMNDAQTEAILKLADIVALLTMYLGDKLKQRDKDNLHWQLNRVRELAHPAPGRREG
jgi:hypothetical protein